jgi:hypothetical protein
LQFDIAGNLLSHEAAPCADASLKVALKAYARLQFVVRTLGPGWRPGVLPRFT